MQFGIKHHFQSQTETRQETRVVKKKKKAKPRERKYFSTLHKYLATLLTVRRYSRYISTAVQEYSERNTWVHHIFPSFFPPCERHFCVSPPQLIVPIQFIHKEIRSSSEISQSQSQKDKTQDRDKIPAALFYHPLLFGVIGIILFAYFVVVCHKNLD